MRSNTETIERAATRQDVAGALVTLSCLPKRQSVDAVVEFEAYCVALEGIASATLAGAVKAILRNALGHAFFPSPPELRGQCDRIRSAQLDEMANKQRKRRMAEEQAQFAPVVHTKEQMARVARAHKAFLDSLRPMNEADEIEAIRAKYDPKDLERIPDRPTGAGMGPPGGEVAHE
ncbi:hypothetical protein MesoLj113c_14500 [Mesorhizobium sp. 113-3-9]|uniref:hypothetical protein n=1 Tax=Mesorhizobium sp. 113-3-9 TaxID=2744517 RepID=UPI001927FE3F|nr:hypothetical protein [Mesorhizobium sp. 113-3-9]BCG85340.1 hypothetical protein MesoLj113c_14500 [Mesorhizobium sp. 113-3-9]